jgi:dihydrofolate reductase
VRKLKEEFDGELQVPDSYRLVQELIESDLVDQINVMVFPVLLGTGKKASRRRPSDATSISSNRGWSVTALPC